MEIFVESTEEEKNTLSNIDNKYLSYIEQRTEETQFLFSLIKREKPLKILEVGVSSGASSIVILSAIKEIKGSHLHSIDYSTSWYRDKSKKSGFIVDDYPELKKNWTLHTGGVASNFMKDIGGDIDLFFLDTMHLVPGEALDFLMVLPYLKKEAILILHDTNMQSFKNKYGLAHRNCVINNLLMSAIVGTKILPKYYKDFFAAPNLQIEEKYNTHPNIAAIKLSEETNKNIWNVFNLLSLNWSYLPTQKDFTDIQESFKKHYDEFYCSIFTKSFYWNEFKYEKNTLLQQIFSIKNIYSSNNKPFKVITILGIQIKIKQ